MAASLRSAVSPPEIRLYKHPGKATSDRLSFVRVDAAPAYRLHVAHGEDLFGTIHDYLDRVGAKACAFVLRGGETVDPIILTGGPGKDGFPMGFLGPHAIAGTRHILAGAGTTGLDADDSHFSHCHAVLQSTDGHLTGGHLMSGKTIAGAAGIAVDIFVIGRGHFVRREEAETLFHIFHPEAG